METLKLQYIEDMAMSEILDRLAPTKGVRMDELDLELYRPDTFFVFCLKALGVLTLIAFVGPWFVLAWMKYVTWVFGLPTC